MAAIKIHGINLGISIALRYKNRAQTRNQPGGLIIVCWTGCHLLGLRVGRVVHDENLLVAGAERDEKEFIATNASRQGGVKVVAAGVPVAGVRYFTAPLMRPLMTHRCAMTYPSRAGIIAIR